jgi:hypothetical protein
MLTNTARWPGPKAGWRVGMWAEASLGLDFFRSFCIKAKRTEEKLGANTFEVLVSVQRANELIQ